MMPLIYNIKSTILISNFIFESELNKKKQEIEAKSKELDKISKDIITFSDEVLVQEYGLYQPRYNFMSSDVL